MPQGFFALINFMYCTTPYVPWSVIYRAGKRNSRNLNEYKPIVKNVEKVVRKSTPKKTNTKVYNIVKYGMYIDLWKNFVFKKSTYKYSRKVEELKDEKQQTSIEVKKESKTKFRNKNVHNGSYHMRGFVCFQVN